jgi:UDP-N-acetylmuramoyl-tripeptide--D-alanyl-D-alanine ligase
MSSLQPLDGRGRRHKIRAGDGAAELIDESYNASPASMRAALAVLGAMIPGKGARRIAVLGDMLELGDEARRLHAELAQPIAEGGIALVFTVGPNMRALYDALPKRLRGGHAASSAEMAEIIARRLRAGDIVTVKGSYGSRMAEVVKRLLAGQSASASIKG